MPRIKPTKAVPSKMRVYRAARAVEGIETIPDHNPAANAALASAINGDITISEMTERLRRIARQTHKDGGS